MKKILTSLLLVVFSLLVMQNITFAEEAVTLSISADNSTNQVQRLKDIYLVVNTENVSDFYTVRLEITYNPEILELETGDITNLAWPASECSYSAIELDSEKGNLKIIFSRLGKNDGLSGRADIAGLKFKGKRIGKTDINIVKAYFVNSQGKNINAAEQNGMQVEVLPNPLDVKLEGTAGNNGWYTSGVKISVEDLDAKIITCSIDGNKSDYVKPFIYTVPGYHKLEVITDDGYGYLKSKTVDFKIDNVLPSVECSPAKAEWLNSEIRVEPFYWDVGGSELAGMWYKWSLSESNPGEWMDYNGGALCQSEQGVWYLHTIVEDGAGNTKYKCFGPYMIDLTPPEISINKESQDIWDNKDISIQPYCSDTGGSGIKSIEYSWSSNPQLPEKWQCYSNGSLIMDTSGEWYLFIKATDNAGNISVKRFGVYRLDKIVPTAEASPDKIDWVNSEVSVSVKYSDEGGSQLKDCAYMWSNSKDCPSQWDVYEGGDIEISAEGIWYLHLMASDNSGNSASYTFGPYNIDLTAPEITVDKKNQLDWTNADIEILPNIIDNGGSNLKSVYYSWSIDSQTPAEWILYDNGSIKLSADGEWYLFVKAEDNAGNIKTECFGVYRMDKTAPEIAALPDTLGWVNTDIEVEPAFTDEGGSKLFTTEYAWTENKQQNPDNWSLFTEGKLVQPLEGIWYLQLRAADNAGNTTNKIFGPYSIDKTNPVSNASPSESDWINTDMIVAPTFTDEGGSLIKCASYSWSNTADGSVQWQSCSSGQIVQPNEGIWYLSLMPEDNAGNSSTSVFGPYRIDKTAPAISHKFKEEYLYMESTSLSFEAVDPLSGVGNMSIRVDGQEYEVGSSYTFSLPGKHVITLSASDNTGNTSTVEFEINVVVQADITAEPGVINIKEDGGKGKGESNGMITVLIQFPEGVDVNDIQHSSILLNGACTPVSDTKYGYVKNPVGDFDGDGRLEYMLKFNRGDVINSIVEACGSVTISGNAGNYNFRGAVTITVK